jgi:hypothetical protein
MNPSATIIAQLRELQALTSARADMLEESRDQERDRAEAAEAELRELRRVVDAWKAADASLAGVVDGEQDRIFAAYEVFNAAEEALRHA